MPTATYTPLQTITLSSSASSVTFGSIPNTFKDLIVVIAGTSSAAATFGVRFNSDSANNYNYVEMNSQAGVVDQSAGSLNYALVGRTNTSQSTNIGQIMDYSATDKHKIVLGRGGSASEIVRASASRWANTAAVTTVSVISSTSSFSSGTTVSLYGISG